MQQNGNFTQVSFTIDTIFYSAPFSYRVVPFCGGLILSLTFFQIHKPLQMTQRPISEYLSPETKTVIEYDCMPTFANILAAGIIDMDENRIVKSFGIKKGIGPEIPGIFFLNKRSFYFWKFENFKTAKITDRRDHREFSEFVNRQFVLCCTSQTRLLLYPTTQEFISELGHSSEIEKWFENNSKQ